VRRTLFKVHRNDEAFKVVGMLQDILRWNFIDAEVTHNRETDECEIEFPIREPPPRMMRYHLGERIDGWKDYDGGSVIDVFDERSSKLSMIVQVVPAQAETLYSCFANQTIDEWSDEIWRSMKTTADLPDCDWD
jgi:hypothetical protein